MFDALLKSKFYTRSKSEMKMTMRRIEIIKRKRDAVERFIRNDVADLLNKGLDNNAYDRVEQLFSDRNLSWCYEFVEHSCRLVISQLSAMNKQRYWECPEECKEAIPTLMFAAARFADLPELRELRSLFYERDENHLEPYVNQEFVKNLKANIPTKEIKVQMMQEIAAEYGIKWDSKHLEQKIYKPPTVVQETKIKETEKEKTEVAMGHTLKNSLPVAVGHTLKISLPHKPRAKIEEKPIGNSLPYKSRAEIEAQKEAKHDHGRLSPYWSSNTSTCSETTTSPDDSASEDTPQVTKFNASHCNKTESNKKSTVSDTRFQSDMPEERKLNELRSMGPPYIKPEETEKISKPVPRSVRVRRPLNLKPVSPVSGSSCGKNDVLNGESHDLDNGYREEQEKKMDKVLSDCKRKPLQFPATARTGSLPNGPMAAVDERKGLARVATYQPDSDLGPRGNVHPKFPDYDDFVAQLAAFRASS